MERLGAGRDTRGKYGCCGGTVIFTVVTPITSTSASCVQVQVLSSTHGALVCSLAVFHEVGTSIILILQPRKQKHKQLQ